MCKEYEQIHACRHYGAKRLEMCAPIRARRGFCTGVAEFYERVGEKCPSCQRAEGWLHEGKAATAVAALAK
ncbi:hypothetical protein BFW01_g9671 [Lasiodiplodia theobromae]|uniref:Uncharacterized protein n=2 Tax=Lasiodiplodia TaxID=66739 RepID=A0A5N5D0D0_9PEZI|nr:uncharacterized protein LTHEOB_2487 [Lasiodiplodia theobromae]KAB2571103.1 hypothetical protein DBV05_g10239 [Lasiodiplodia theobromae]KAF4535495.1 hypothetical protein LTHEOB_2487 [Lasiodiplodia theobromae]KAF9638774.1 hypothetical protein BFW01_g9671 [Lasiodiplodia theobromae]KAK0660552.1 hypothetical protein DIS24_g3049 [Lasiodiplodia hormozganensis]